MEEGLEDLVDLVDLEGLVEEEELGSEEEGLEDLGV